MRCPTCRNRELIAIADLSGHRSGRCPECRGLWCTPEEAVARHVFANTNFADAEHRPTSVAIAHCPACEQPSLTPVNAACALSVRPLLCVNCSDVWVHGSTLDVIRGVAPVSVSRMRHTSAAESGLFARIAATFGADTQENEDTRGADADDIERHPLTLAAAVPIMAIMIWLLDLTNIGRFLQQTTVGMVFHESGHALAGWLNGMISIPLPLLTVSTGHRGVFAYLVSTLIIGMMVWRGIRRRLPFCICVGVFAGYCLIAKGLLSGAEVGNQWITYSRVGGEFILGTLCAVAFFHRLYRKPSWDVMRYPTLFFGLAALLPAWHKWLRVDAGTEPFPLGSAIYGDSDGDMNRLLAAGFGQQSIIDSYLAIAHWCVALLFVHWAWTAWRGYVLWQQRIAVQ